MKSLVKICSVLIITIMSTHLGFAQQQQPTYFTNTYGAGEAKSMIVVSDSVHGTCYVIAGISGGVDGNGFLMKVDAYGDTLWTRSYGTHGYEIINTVKQTADEGFILVGKSDHHPSGVLSALAIKTDANGNVEWSQTYRGTGSGSSSLNGIEIFDVEVVDDGFVMAGSSRAFQNSPLFKMWVAKISLGGQLMWSRTYFNSGAALSIKKTSDGGFVIAQQHIQSNMALTKIDSVGNSIWSKTYGNLGAVDLVSGMILTSTGYLILGTTSSSGSYESFILKTDFNGDYQWSRRISGKIHPILGAMEDADGGLVIAGGCSGWFCFLKTDSVGNLLWANELGNNMMGSSIANQVILAPNGYLIAGQLENHLGLIRIDSLGNPACHGYPVPVVSIFSPAQTAAISVTDSLVTPLVSIPNLEITSGCNITTICAINHPVSPYNKLKVINIWAPKTPVWSGYVFYPSFRVKNYRADTITSFDFFYSYTKIEGPGTPPQVSAPETWTGVLLPNQQLDIVMNDLIMVYFGPGELCIQLMVTGDTITGNDTLCTQTHGFTNIQEAGKEVDDVQLFPNPSTGEITTTREGKLVFFNLAGKLVYEKEVQPYEKIQLPLPAGVYIYSLNGKKGKLILL